MNIGRYRLSHIIVCRQINVCHHAKPMVWYMAHILLYFSVCLCWVFPSADDRFMYLCSCIVQWSLSLLFFMNVPLVKLRLFDCLTGFREETKNNKKKKTKHLFPSLFLSFISCVWTNRFAQTNYLLMRWMYVILYL